MFSVHTPTKKQKFRTSSLVGVLLLFSTLLQGPVKAETQIYQSPAGPLEVTTLLKGLENPWAMAFLPDNQGMLITERPGRLRFWSPPSGLTPALEGVPQVFAQGQGGLLDVVLAPDFLQSRRVYLSYAEGSIRNPREGPAGTAVGYGVLSDDKRRLQNFQVIFRQQPKLSSGVHFGSRLVFDGKGHLYIALGENNQRPTAQDLDKLQGKLVRVNADGSVPQDNPFVGREGVAPEIWSYGHRNQQGAALNPATGVVWTHEHGPRGGDEINIPQAGKNYGWPLATHGINYSGLAIPEAKGKSAPGTEAPHYVWEKSPAISGMAFYDSDRFKPWANSLFIGALVDKSVIRLTLEGDRIAGEERLLKELGARIRDVRQGPDGYLYVLTDERDGRLLKVGLQP
ncbi:MAG TPA: PQQ-dependent sugar dehydrogenase [Pusillimonas sp.]|uniref:PQQ-dependent sugar dehydrogenase n=1 Tax=Pusillimonas sp. TaxID=3040095 RepID=UPI002BE95CA8|nr:PQQ-dependent sugar dehydrogenase [Pusillimonas sp.]HUH87523.1 PQQ-dependent sugar dehydrogenase [Pusillimonas sp.]